MADKFFGVKVKCGPKEKGALPVESAITVRLTVTVELGYAVHAPDGEVHAYLCFTFGTDEQARWSDISQTLDTQSRIVQQPDGQIRLSAIGRAIEEAMRGLESGAHEPPG